MAIYRLGDMIRMRREALGMTQNELVEIYGTEELKNGKSEKMELKDKLKDSKKYNNNNDRIEDSKKEKSGNFNFNTKDYKKRKNSNKNEDENNEICSTQVLRRIEKGTVGRVKIETFRKIMRKMGVLPEKTYASLLVTDCRALNLKPEIHMHILRQEYEQAEKKLSELEKKMVPGYPRNEQYRMEKKATLEYKRGRMSAEEYLDVLWGALKYTVPKLDDIDIADWPFNMNEFDILIGIENAYHAMKNREKELEFLLKLKKNVEREYMDRNHYVVWHEFVLACLSQLMCITGQKEQSLEYCEIGMKEAIERRILGNADRFLYDIAWNRENAMRKEDIKKEENLEQKELWKQKEREFCKKQLVQAYYLSAAGDDAFKAERVKKLFETFYPEEIRFKLF